MVCPFFVAVHKRYPFGKLQEFWPLVGLVSSRHAETLSTLDPQQTLRKSLRCDPGEVRVRDQGSVGGMIFGELEVVYR